MARQLKKIQNKIAPKEKNSTPAKQEKIGKDYLLIGVICFTVFVMVTGWQNFDFFNRSLYVLLSLSLAFTYARRHANLNEYATMWLDRASFVCIGFAVVIFLSTIYNSIFG